ncbi:DUF2391 family protein [Candidatus Latescibacterota bacterium]
MTIDQQSGKMSVRRIGGYLHYFQPILDNTGKVIGSAVRPLMVEVRPRDILQMIIGASVLAIPVGFTEECWTLGENLPLRNVIILSFISVLFISTFVYFNFYRFHLKGFEVNFIKRCLSIYIVSIILVGLLLTLIQKCPWGVNNIVALKRIIIVAFPASMSAAISDMLK